MFYIVTVFSFTIMIETDSNKFIVLMYKNFYSSLFVQIVFMFISVVILRVITAVTVLWLIKFKNYIFKINLS